MLNHVTYHVLPGTLADPDLSHFMRLIGLREIEPDDPFEHGWKVRWFMTEAARRPLIHLVEGEWRGWTDDKPPYQADNLALGHLCVSGHGLSVIRMRAERKGWLARDSGSGRIWLQFANLRVEVRP